MSQEGRERHASSPKGDEMDHSGQQNPEGHQQSNGMNGHQSPRGQDCEEQKNTGGERFYSNERHSPERMEEDDDSPAHSRRRRSSRERSPEHHHSRGRPYGGQERRRRHSGSQSEGSRGGRGGSHDDRSMEPREDDSKTFTQVYISKITRKCQPEHLEKEFEAIGKIQSIQMKGNYAFISFEEHEGAVAAIEKMNGKPFQGQEIVVEKSQPPNRRKRQGPQREDECWYCGKRGHWANECRSKRSGGGSRGGRRGDSREAPRRYRSRTPPRRGDRHERREPDRRERRHSRDRSARSGSREGDRGDGRSRQLREGLCFNCGEKGHIRVNCPEGDNGRGGGDRGGRGGGDRDHGMYERRGRGGGRDHRDSRRGPDRGQQRRYPSGSRSRSRSYGRDNGYGRQGGHHREQRERRQLDRPRYNNSPSPRSGSPPRRGGEERYQ